jgi:hypothetical protein
MRKPRGNKAGSSAQKRIPPGCDLVVFIETPEVTVAISQAIEPADSEEPLRLIEQADIVTLLKRNALARELETLEARLKAALAAGVPVEPGTYGIKLQGQKSRP